MRHFFAARPVAALSRSMAAAPRWAILVALSGALDAAAPGVPGTVFGTINLAAVAAAADQHLEPTSGAHIEPGGHHAGIVASADIMWTSATIVTILDPHACPARCGARRRA